MFFGKFYLDKEKDVVVKLYIHEGRMNYELSTPNHHSGNLIKNLAKIVNMPVSVDENGLSVLKGEILSYIDGENHSIYIMRLGNTKVANIYPNGKIERKAYIPAIAKTLMSQTRVYGLDMNQTLVKTYIRTEVKFHADLHSHRSANLSPDLLIALGIHHQIRYPYYYVKKLKLKITQTQKEEVESRRTRIAERFADSGLKGKYLDRKIDDNTFLNFADLIMNNIADSTENIVKIRASLAVRKDGQAVFTDLEKVYLYRYVFTKGIACDQRISYSNVDEIEDRDIVHYLHCMEKDRKNANYAENSLFQDKLLWTARQYAAQGIQYAEISDTALVKKSDAAFTLREIHEIMPKIIAETGVTLRFLAAFRRVPLTIVKDDINKTNYFLENLQVLKAVAGDPYVAGSDFVGEEINDIMELKPVIEKIVEIANGVPGYVLRIHAGENDSLPDNVLNSILCVEDSLKEDQPFPMMRIGHGLYTAKLGTPKGKMLLDKLKERGVVLEFQITSNVRLNNLSEMKNHPLKQYLKKEILCVQGTDGGALYGTDSIDEELSLERMLNLSFEELMQMRRAEEVLVNSAMNSFQKKWIQFQEVCREENVEAYYQQKIRSMDAFFLDVPHGERKYVTEIELKKRIKPLPLHKIPIIVVGGSFNSANHVTKINAAECELIDDLLQKADPQKVFFVIGCSFKGYEKYLYDKAKDRFEIYAYLPAAVTRTELKYLEGFDVPIRVSIEASPMGVYKSVAFEIFKCKENILLALDGNSAAGNLIQDTKNAKYESRRFINSRSIGLRSKAESLQGYVTMWNGENADMIVATVEKMWEKQV